MWTHIENTIRDLGQEGLRVLAVTYRRLDRLPDELVAGELEKDLSLIGLVAMTDPARPEVKPAVEKARRAGIRTMMITGDYPDTARAIAQQIGLIQDGDHRVIAGSDLNEMSDEQLREAIAHTSVFALREVLLGIAPATIAPYVLRKMGERWARDYFLTGRKFDAQRAHEIGLVDDVVEPDALESEAKRWVRRFLRPGPRGSQVPADRPGHDRGDGPRRRASERRQDRNVEHHSL